MLGGELACGGRALEARDTAAAGDDICPLQGKAFRGQVLLGNAASATL